MIRLSPSRDSDFNPLQPIEINKRIKSFEVAVEIGIPIAIEDSQPERNVRNG
jgi:hypothetical protein